MGMKDQSHGRHQNQEPDATLSLAELTEQAGVTVRTVRYYIAEGLLPPPVSAGRQSAYTRGHLDRLRLIARLKEAYLPLKEIRRQLAGLDDDAVRHLLEQDVADAPSAPTPERAPSSARAYLDQVLGAPARSRARSARRINESRPRAWPDAPSDADEDRSVPMAPLQDEPSPWPAPALSSIPDPDVPDRDAEPEPWRRVRLGDDAELLIRESSYRQRQDRVDWLIRWARRVFR